MAEHSLKELHYSNNEKIFADGISKDGLPYLYFPLLESTGAVRHIFSTRLGGVSSGILESLNLSDEHGDSKENLNENIRRATAAVGSLPEDVVCSHQTHTTNVRTVSWKDRGKGVTIPRDYSDVDGLITNDREVCLMTFYADCVPLFFVDPRHRAIGLSHSGWRGTAGQMGAVTLKRMNEEYGTRPEDTYAAIGPSICVDCYEVGEELIEIFQDAYDRKWWPQLYRTNEKGRYQLDLQASCRITLREAGISENHLAVSNLCTCCNSELLFSHRATKGKRGTLGALMRLV